MRSGPRAVVLAAVSLLATAALAACAATGAAPASAPRSAPNESEQTAVIRASGFDGSGGRLELGAPWVQLWTQQQLPAAIESCLRSGVPVDACYAAHPVDSRVYAMNEAQRVQLYGYYLTSLDRCLTARGFRIGRIPERIAFLSGINDGKPWSPYDSVTVGTRAEWYLLSDACPPVPATIDDSLRPR